MGKKGGSPPPPPDPRETGQAQTATNVSTTIASAWLANPSQITPFGDLRFMQHGTYVWFDPLDKSPGRREAERLLAEWMDANPPPVPPSPDLLSTNPDEYYAAIERYREWERERNAYVRQLAAEHGVNIYTIPLLTAYQALSPDQKQILDELNRANYALAQTAADQTEWLREYLANRNIDTSDLPELPDPEQIAAPNLAASLPDVPDYVRTYGTDWSEDRRRVEEAILSRLEDEFEQDRERLRAELAAQGIWYGSEAYDRAMDELNRKWNDARMQAILAGGQEQSRLAELAQQRAAFENAVLNQAFRDAMARTSFANRAEMERFAADMQRAQLASQLRAQGMQEAYAARGQPINEIISLIHGTQLREPRFISANIQPIPITDYAGIEAENYRARLAAWQAEQQFGLQALGMGLGFLGALLSDPRKKKAVRKTGRTLKQVALVEYRYKGEPQHAPKRLGVLASEVERKRPDAVIEMRRRGKRHKGLRYVDYGRLAQ